jgi:hypothetical protein
VDDALERCREIEMGVGINVNDDPGDIWVHVRGVFDVGKMPLQFIWICWDHLFGRNSNKLALENFK